MKCAHCGNEIEMGSVFCRCCGREAQIVPDYNVLEDDILTSILEEETTSSSSRRSHASGQKPAEQDSSATETNGVSPWKKPGFQIAALLIGIAAFAGIAAAIYFSSYSYHMSAAMRLEGEKSYQESAGHYLKAAERRKDACEPLAGAGHAYLLLKEYDTAEAYLQKAIEKNPSCEDAYVDLIQVYFETKEYAKIDRLLADVTDDDILHILNEHLLSPPVFSIAGGKFTDDVPVELSCREGHDIYLTLDGSDPTGNSIRYQEPIVLKDGDYTIRAACCDASGKFGRIEEQCYEITYEKPDYAKVMPMQGTFDVPTQIFMEAPKDGCRIYYTWDGTAPTKASPEYTGPIDVLEGNNVLSVLVIDRHGLCSDILKCNYKYLP